MRVCWRRRGDLQAVTRTAWGTNPTPRGRGFLWLVLWLSTCGGGGQLPADASAVDGGASDSKVGLVVDLAPGSSSAGRVADTAAIHPAPRPRTSALQAACDDLASGACARLDACGRAIVAMRFGAPGGCRAVLREVCLIDATAPAASVDAGDVSDCARRAPTLSCRDLAEADPASACRWKGLVPAGFPCGSHAQCMSGVCERDGPCGLCARVRGLGSECSGEGEGCEPDLVCFDDICLQPGRIGEGCSARPCQEGLTCLNKQCRPLGGTGSVCEDSDDCRRDDGLFCFKKDDGQVNGVCQPVRNARMGQACGHNQGVETVCVEATSCQAEKSGDDHCVSPAVDGEACGDGAKGRPCALPSVCEQGTCGARMPNHCS